jgi:adenylate cyclase
MPYLIAQGEQPQQRWRRRVPTEMTAVLGRDAGLMSVPWDGLVSRQHAVIRWDRGKLSVTKHESATNAIFVRGREVEQFALLPGEHFVIGTTTFTLADENVHVASDTPWPVTEKTFSSNLLQDYRFRDADKRIDLLSRIPEIISGSTNDIEVCVRITNLMLDSIPTARAAAVVVSAPEQEEVSVLHWDRRALDENEFAPSGRLIRQSIEQAESVVHVWESMDLEPGNPTYTQACNVDWAFSTPLPGKASAGWAIYVSGGFGGNSAVRDPDQLQDELKFTELVATTLANLRESQQLQRNQASLRQFFSPVVLDALAWQDPDQVLAPKEVDVSVLFCDLRGFSRSSEESANDLLGLLNRVSNSLGVMTHHILEQGGVVGDFHGDAAMGFWGWPLRQEDSAERACHAALAIRQAFEIAAQTDSQSLRDFRVGIGVATGKAVAGKIGTVDHVKVTVFGPVVNLASRLESMTKKFRAPILLDETTANIIRKRVPKSVARTRRVATVKPYGMQTSLEVCELLPSEKDYPAMTDEHVAVYEQAVDALKTGDWEHAFQLLHQVPAEDRVKDFLTVLIAQHNREAPDGWDGVISLDSK